MVTQLMVLVLMFFKSISYPRFGLISVYSDKELRKQTLTTRKNMSDDEAEKLIDRDASESIKNGQQTTDAFHLADFFIEVNGDETYLINQISRIFDLVFGNPFITPTFDEYAMYMAFASSLRSADLSRQVGAVIVKDTAILSTGANDVPKFGGGVYWPYFSDKEKKVIDTSEGRDFMRGEDSNTVTKIEIIEEIISKLPKEVRVKFEENEIESLKQHLKSSRLKDITEYGRVVHAEMDAILNCARSNTNTHGTELFCTTFPCHNCAKHIVASGIKRVVYIEPYPKSKAITFHKDTIALKTSTAQNDKVIFEPFVGVGPRSFFNLFSLNFGSGYTLFRKDNAGKTKSWDAKKAYPRVPLLPLSYIEKEQRVAQQTAIILEKLEKKNG